MTVLARAIPRSGRRPFASRGARSAESLWGLIALPWLGLPVDANSQVSFSADVRSDYIYRGVSLSGGRATVGLNVTFDGKGGVYGGASAIGEDAPALGPRGLGATEVFGYAWRPAEGPTVDLGLSNLSYAGYGYTRKTVDATEIYAGILRSSWNLYLHYSPNDFSPGIKNLYAEANGSTRLVGPVRLVGHIGFLAPVDGRPGRLSRADSRAGLAARFKSVEVQLFWSSVRANPLYADEPERRAGEVAAMLTCDF